MGGWVISLYCTFEYKFSLYLSFHVIAFNHFPFISKEINDIFILELISYQHLELIIFQLN
jgi:hypothetical protein